MSQPSPRSAAGAGARERLAFAALLLGIVACWLLQNTYDGLTHDSVLYSFAGLARLHPQSLGNDVFLRLGSQDQYTIFSPLVAAAIQACGLERGAALLTLCSQMALFGCAWLLARRLMGPIQALFAVGLLIVLPSVYGDEHRFSYTETFLTPRLAAEALVLAALACIAAKRFKLGALSVIGALLVHPLMAAAGLVMLFFALFGMSRPRTTLLLSVIGIVALYWVAARFPIGPVARFDALWFNLLHSRMHYLFPSLWTHEDWGHTCVPLAELAVGCLTLTRPPLRSICGAAALTGVAGLLLALIGSDLLHIVLVTQVQPWRWLWLSDAVAVLVIPVIATDLWRAGTVRRATAVLLAAAWVCVDESFVPIIALLAVAAAAAGDRITAERHQRLVMFGAYAVLLIGTLLFVGTVVSVIHKLARIPADASLYDSPYLLWLRQQRPWSSGGIIPTCILLAIGWLAVRAKSGNAALGAVVLSIGLCVAFAPLALTAWTRSVFPEQTRVEFAGWRREIPPQAEVLWVDSPLGPWYLLERSSYWTLRQMAGLVFSRATAVELTRRESILTNQPVRELASQELDDLCQRAPDLAYIVIERDLGPTPFPTVAFQSAGSNSGVLRLYRCADHRR